MARPPLPPYERKLPVILGAAVLFLGCCFCLFFALFGASFRFEPPMDYVVEAEFEELPPDDSELKAWLLKQPGVYIAFVDRDGQTVGAIWGNSSTTYLHPVTPNLRKEFERFGCKGLISYKERKEYRDK
jgi:hypothetical protein